MGVLSGLGVCATLEAPLPYGQLDNSDNPLHLNSVTTRLMYNLMELS